MSALRRAALVARREALAERRQPDGLVTALTFAAVLILVESLAIGPGEARRPQIASAVYWMTLLFAALFAAARSFDRELEDDAIDAVLALDGGRDALFLGKVAALAALLAIVGLVAGLLALVVLNLDVALPGHLVASALLAVAALPPVVVLDTLLALRLRARGALVAILALPLLVPALLAATQSTTAALTGDAASWGAWCGLLVAFTIVYGVLGLTIVPAATE